MDVMSIRRGLMMAMASGAQYVKGMITVAQGAECTINFGKTFSRYLYFIEMNDASKTTLLASGESGAKSYARCGVVPSVAIGNVDAGLSYWSQRINPATSEQTYSAISNYVVNATGSSITFKSANSISSGAHYLYAGYTYNYYIVEIK